MRRTVHINELRDHINLAQQALAQEKDDIIDLIPPTKTTNKEEYAFLYIRAERYGTAAIQKKAQELDWLPMHVDPVPEMLGKKRHPLNKWILSYAQDEPDSVDFGNEFMHALTRTAKRYGWNSQTYNHVLSRIVKIFFELTCLLNAAYFLAVIAENDIEYISFNLTDDNETLAKELAHVIQTPEIYVVSRKGENKKIKKNIAPHKKQPHLRVVESEQPHAEIHNPDRRH